LVIAKVLKTTPACGVAALGAVPLRSSDPETWLIVENAVTPGFVVWGVWKAVPQRRDYAILLTCTDSLHCFSDANPGR